MGWALIQQQPVQTTNSNPSATYPGATTAGNLLVALLGTALTSGITMPTGWTQRAITQHSGSPPAGTVIIAEKIADGTETAVTFTASSATYALEILEFSGNTQAAEFDAASAGTQQASTVTSVQPGSLTPAQGSELFVVAEFNSAAGTNTGSEAADSGFTVLDAATFTYFIPAYKAKSDATAENPTLSWATARACLCIQAAFIPAAPPLLNRLLRSQAIMRAATR